jgi:ribosome-associated translation inhibitor RaiA
MSRKKMLMETLRQLYALKDEGKNVQAAIDNIEEELRKECERECDRMRERKNK